MFSVIYRFGKQVDQNGKNSNSQDYNFFVLKLYNVIIFKEKNQLWHINYNQNLFNLVSNSSVIETFYEQIVCKLFKCS